MQNTITCNNYNFKITKKANKPFSNNFVMLESKITQYAGQDEITAYVTCTAKSKEPGRIYVCVYSLQGDLIACETVN
jgi:hypothetical protein